MICLQNDLYQLTTDISLQKTLYSSRHFTIFLYFYALTLLFFQVDYDLSAEDVQYLMYTEMLLYRPSSAKFPPPPSNNNLANGGRCPPLLYSLIYMPPFLL